RSTDHESIIDRGQSPGEALTSEIARQIGVLELAPRVVRDINGAEDPSLSTEGGDPILRRPVQHDTVPERTCVVRPVRDAREGRKARILDPPQVAETHA